jgi:hypothetical protein
VVVVTMCVPVLGAAASDPPPDPWLTVAERSGFRATSSYDETLEFIERLAERMPEIRLDFYGTSPQGRRMPVVIVSADRDLTPQSAAASGKALVLIQNGIHSGEIDGKDACLMILRDMALGSHRELLRSLNLLIIPIYNVDGHERVSPYNRANQNGPVEGMGFRTTADGHDLNRDHLKLETPEARAVIGLFNRWKPHLHVDNHVTNGVDHDWVLTYTWVESPQLAPSLDAWVSVHLAAAVAATEQAGHRVGPYVSLLDRNDPEKGFQSYVGEPRYATGYYPLRNRPSILVENHAYKPYRERVLANRDFLLALLEQTAEGRETLIAAVRTAEQLTVSRGAATAEPSRAVLTFEAETPSDRILFPVYAWETRPSTVLGVPLIRYRSGEVREIEVPWSHRPHESLSVARPRGYLVLPGWPVIEQRLQDHALRVRRLTREASVEVETIRISGRPREGGGGSTYQGRVPTAVDVERTAVSQRVPPGTLWIPADQPDFEVAVQLLEPEAADSLVSWGLLSIVMERKEYIDSRKLEELAPALLDDPETRRAWKDALKNEEFASDPSARWAWWYRRTPYWDDTVGLLPVLRVMEPPTLSTEPWSAPGWSIDPAPIPQPGH